MGPFQRILKNLAALLTGRVISIVQQYIVPPIFVWRYGLAGYGEWAALSGAVAVLGTLNFGVQTFMNQDLAIRLNRGETEGYHIRQSTALRLMLTIVTTAALLFTGFFFVPFDTMLKLDIGRSAAQWTAFLLALQVLLTILFGYFAGIFMGVNLAHRGTHWNNTQALVSALGLLVGVALHQPFVVLAGIQLSSLALCVVGVLIDIRRTAPAIFPSLRYWDGEAIGGILKGSGYFAMIEVSTFLVYQAPLLIMQRIVGPVAVAAFTFMRTIFSTCRQILSVFTQAMGAEITGLFGRRDWPGLSRLYNVSERLIFFLIALVNLTVLMLSPVLITLWIHKKSAAGVAHGTVSELFTVAPYVISSALSMVISLKEHKHQFQFSTNTHVELARVVFFSYLAMVFVSIFTVQYWGVNGFLWTWLAVETIQTAFLVSLNSKLFAHVEAIDTIYILRLTGICGVGLALAAFMLPVTSATTLWTQTGIGLGAAAVVGLVAWQVFGVREVYSSMTSRLAKRFA
jgi:O-antigen/teichoic acid export membrane protein